MPGVLPDGEPVGDDGALPAEARAGAGTRPFGFYVHVPFCVARCGYCDFNTYTAEEARGVTRGAYHESLIAEVRLARRVLGDADLPVSTVFFGGGTPTLLAPEALGAVLRAIGDEFGLAGDAEITTEANPESVTPGSLRRLREVGINRISLGMQSAREHVLRTLDRVHTAGRPQQCVTWAREAGFEQVSLDLIYGTPGETDDDWRATLDEALAAGPDHVSAYALMVEDGTRLAARIRRGELDPPDDDAMADRYLVADERLRRAGLRWYEISNWAASPRSRCRHNELYWTGGHWWGAGPGAHSHVSGVRWWNVKHPAPYAGRLAAGRSPAHGRETLTARDRTVERIMLETRLADGLPLATLDARGRTAAAAAVDDGLLDPARYRDGRIVLTLRGRLLADAVVRTLT